ncbi:DUF6114 domain-containing protein [Kitasatospora sp. Ki12]|uniref:DUF6114 domain-containing protein n=1 Tax=Kitasatospora xanthocidica TaxID=83382 RepID=UPI0019A11E7B|nr:DUF6114 domain-containing protein [Kitasatospora xanthocidica]GHF45618.1 hypothetical protein GCM10018790_24310 [Kitasatospora xanthocidica]
MSSATVEPRTGHQNPIGWLWRHFRDFRRTRPFWGGLLAMIAGVPILYFPYAHLTFGGLTIAMSTTAGAGSLIIGVLMIILGLTAWFQPAVRVFGGIATILLTLVSIPVSNLAGFGLALLPGLIGGGLMVSWAPLPEPKAEPTAKAGRRRRAKGAADATAANAVAESVATAPRATEPAATESVAAEPGAVAEPATEAPTATLPAQGEPQEPAAAPAAEPAAGTALPKQSGATDPEGAR